MGKHKKKDNPACSTADTSDSSQVDIASAIYMDVDIKHLLSNRFDGLTRQISTVSSDLATIKEDVKSLKELKKEIEDVKETANNAHELAESNSIEIGKLKTELALAKDSIRSLQGNCSSLHDYIVHQDAYSRRDNPLFVKVSESKENEDCAKVIRKLFVEELKMDTQRASDIKMIMCHRLGKPKKESVRTII